MNKNDQIAFLAKEIMKWKESGSDFANWEDKAGCHMDDALLFPWNPFINKDNDHDLLKRISLYLKTPDLISIGKILTTIWSKRSSDPFLYYLAYKTGDYAKAILIFYGKKDLK